MTWNNFGLSSAFREFQSQCYSPVVPFLLTPTLPTFDRGSILVAKMRYTCLDHHRHELSDLTRRTTKLLRVRPLPVLCQGHMSRFASSQRHVVMSQHPEFEQVGRSMGFADWEIQYEVEEHQWVFSGLIERVPGIVTMRSCPVPGSYVQKSNFSRDFECRCAFIGPLGIEFCCLGGFEGCLGVPCLCFLRGGGESNAAIVVIIMRGLPYLVGIEQYSSNIDNDDDS
ncbi:hypothetical protein BKA83DRAFT_4128607 [Pisolithus microcarpus]|nr:hypothetical protein BKA83DRAFT_4128607 [Pisolithus microcarpus]